MQEKERQIMSISSDGLVCIWAASDITDPLYSYSVIPQQQRQLQHHHQERQSASMQPEGRLTSFLNSNSNSNSNTAAVAAATATTTTTTTTGAVPVPAFSNISNSTVAALGMSLIQTTTVRNGPSAAAAAAPAPASALGTNNINNQAVCISALAVNIDPDSGVSYIVVGCGSGQIYVVDHPFRPVENAIDMVDAHSGLVSSIQLNPFNKQIQSCQHLFLSASLDWTVKLWSVRRSNGSSSSSSSSSAYGAFTLQCLSHLVSPYYEYIADVRWCPTNPFVFVSASSSGRICLYNITESLDDSISQIEMSSLVTQVNNSLKKPDGTGATNVMTGSNININTNSNINSSTPPLPLPLPASINTVCWSNDGSSLLVGDNKGTVYRLLIRAKLVDRAVNDIDTFDTVLSSIHLG